MHPRCAAKKTGDFAFLRRTVLRGRAGKPITEKDAALKGRAVSPLPRRRHADMMRKIHRLGATLREVERRLVSAEMCERVILEVGRDAIQEEMTRLGRALG